MNLDTRSTLEIHKKTIQRKYFLKKVYIRFYQEIESLLPKKVNGKVIELGSGAGFIKEVIPECITSDIVPGKGMDSVIDASKIPFQTKGVSAFVMLNTFHHIKDLEKALREMQRCLKHHGKIIMIEPYNSFWGKFIYKYFHHEKFDPTTPDWKIKGEGRLTDANSAMPWIIFRRDKKIFKKRFPMLKIKTVRPHTPFAYLISGGFSGPQLLPSFLFGTVKLIENLLTPLNNLLGMFVTIELEKK